MRALRRLAPALAAAFLVGLLPTPASGAERGSIEGRVVNGASGEPQSGVEVTLLGGREDGSGGLTEDVREHVTTGDDGRYEFTGLQTGGDRIYTVDATFRGGLFAGGAIKLPSDTARAPAVKTTLRVWPTITDPRTIVVQRNDLFVVSGDEGTSVIESYKIVNTSDRAYIGRGGSTDADSGDPVPSLSFPLPTRAMSSGVQILNSDLDVPELIETGTGLGITTAVPPDETSITFVYNVRLETGQVELSRRALYPILNFEVFAESPYVVESDRLAEKESEEISGTTYGRYSSAGTIEAGDPIPVTVRAEAGSDTALIAGAIVAAVALLGAVAFALVRRRRRTRAPKRGSSEAPATREQLLTAIARLDLEWRSREIDERSYNSRRAALKRRLRDLEPATQREPTP
ncbi:MAG: carboxypeptidase-like regulatory domain-containing protein [Actinomycetota bacterium]